MCRPSPKAVGSDGVPWAPLQRPNLRILLGDTRIFRRNYLICGIFTLEAESYSGFEVGMGLGAGAAGSRGWSIGLALPLIAFAQNPPCDPHVLKFRLTTQ